MGKQWKQCQTLFWGAPKSLAGGDCSHEIKRRLLLGRKVMTNLDSILKSRDIILPTKVHLVKAMIFPVVMYRYKSWAIKKLIPKNWWFWTVVLKKTLESPLDCKEIKLGNPNGNQPWIFTGRADAEAETPILWPLVVKNWLIWKDPDAGKDWKQEKETAGDEMVGWHHRFNGHEFEQALGVGDGHECLMCCTSWGHRVGHNRATELSWVWINPGSLLHLYFRTLFMFTKQCLSA